MPVFTNPGEQVPLDPSQYPATLGEKVGAALGGSWQVFDWVKTQADILGPNLNAEPIDMVPAARANELGKEYGLHFDNPINSEELAIRMNRIDAERERQRILMTPGHGLASGLVGMVGSFLDPIVGPLTFLPVAGTGEKVLFGAISAAKLAERATLDGIAQPATRLGQTALYGARGAAQGAAIGAMMEGGTALSDSLDQREYDLNQGIRNIGFMGMLGFGGGALHGALSPEFKVFMEKQAKGQAALEQGKPVSAMTPDELKTAGLDSPTVPEIVAASGDGVHEELLSVAAQQLEAGRVPNLEPILDQLPKPYLSATERDAADAQPIADETATNLLRDQHDYVTSPETKIDYVPATEPLPAEKQLDFTKPEAIIADAQELERISQRPVEQAATGDETAPEQHIPTAEELSPELAAARDEVTKSNVFSDAADDYVNCALGLKPVAEAAAQAAVQGGGVAAQEAAPTSAPEPAFSQTLFQGRGATQEEIYGPDAVAQGRAVPLFGNGKYFAFDRDVAKLFGDEITTHDVSLNNPFVLDSDAKWFKLLKDAGTPHLDNTKPLGAKNPAGMVAETHKIQEFLKGNGYDGIVVRLDESPARKTRRLAEMTGDSQVVKFSSDKVK